MDASTNMQDDDFKTLAFYHCLLLNFQLLCKSTYM